MKKPAAIPFSKIYADTKEQKGGRNHLHNERVISELSKRVCGTLQYMMSYVSEISIPNWLVYGFKVNSQCQTLVPNLIPLSECPVDNNQLEKGKEKKLWDIGNRKRLTRGKSKFQVEAKVIYQKTPVCLTI